MVHARRAARALRPRRGRPRRRRWRRALSIRAERHPRRRSRGRSSPSSTGVVVTAQRSRDVRGGDAVAPLKRSLEVPQCSVVLDEAENRRSLLAAAHRQKLPLRVKGPEPDSPQARPSSSNVTANQPERDAPALRPRRRRRRHSYRKDRVARPAVRSRIGSTATEQRDDGSCRHGPVQPPV